MSSTITDGTKYNDFGAVSQSILKQKLISDVNLYKMVLLLPGDVKLSKIFLHHYYDDAGVSLNIKSNLDNKRLYGDETPIFVPKFGSLFQMIRRIYPQMKNSK